jgi:hypothetical protein
VNATNDILDMIHEAQAKIAAMSARLDRMEARQAEIDSKADEPNPPQEP